MIVVLAYEKPHRRSQEVLLRLKFNNNHKDIVVLGLDWIERKNFKPIYKHRFDPLFDVTTKEVASKLNYNYVGIKHKSLYSHLEILKPDVILLAGARLIEKEITDKYKIINSHPGYLPNSRGLDALKWALLLDQPLGVTTHIIDDQVDAGTLIDRVQLHIKPTEDFTAFAYRQFNTEVDMMISAIDNFKNTKGFLSRTMPAKRRMPHRLEPMMMEKFYERRKRGIYEGQ